MNYLFIPGFYLIFRFLYSTHRAIPAGVTGGPSRGCGWVNYLFIPGFYLIFRFLYSTHRAIPAGVTGGPSRGCGWVNYLFIPGFYLIFRFLYSTHRAIPTGVTGGPSRGCGWVNFLFIPGFYLIFRFLYLLTGRSLRRGQGDRLGGVCELRVPDRGAGAVHLLLQHGQEPENTRRTLLPGQDSFYGRGKKVTSSHYQLIELESHFFPRKALSIKFIL